MPMQSGFLNKAVSFERRSKKPLSIVAWIFPEELGSDVQKFFGSFFQKRTFLLLQTT
jgi:hypothetical protein